MWYKVRELQSKGLNKTQIGKHLGVDRSTVRRYLQMSREDFVRRRNSHRKYTLKLAGYEEPEVKYINEVSSFVLGCSGLTKGAAFSIPL